jgi:hypothetical protein
MLIVWDTPIVVGVDDVIQRLRKVAFEKFNADYFGSDPVASGNNLQYRCPFHKEGQERSRSFGVRIDDGRWHCFTCTEDNGGDLPSLIARLLKLDRSGKVTPDLGYRWLLSQFNLAVVGERPSIEVDVSRGRESSIAVVPEEEIQEYLSWSHDYMSMQRMIDPKIQEFLEIGFDVKTESVVFIMRDLKGRAMFIKKRPINPFNDAKYINKKDVNKKNLMFGLWYLHKYKNLYPNQKMIDMCNKHGLWISEGEIDASSFWQCGAPGCCIGGKVFFDTQMSLVRKVGAPFQVLGLDNDDEGRAETERVAKYYEGRLRLKYAEYPSWAKDFNDVIKEGKDLGAVKVHNDYKRAYIRIG